MTELYPDIQKYVDTFWANTTRWLTQREAHAALLKYGKNELMQKEPISPFRIFMNQFKSLIVIILIVAVVVSAIIPFFEHHGEQPNIHWFIEPLVILVIIVLNALLGFTQEMKAEQSIEALQKLWSQQATVLRDGEQQRIEATELVPWDIVILATGDKVPADGRLLTVTMLDIEEAALTGESMPVWKQMEAVDSSALGDQRHKVFAWTVVTKWKGTFIVTQTWMNTEIGKIAHMIHSVEEEDSPLQKQLEHVWKQLWLMTVGICVIVFAIWMIRKQDLFEFFMTSVSLAVAAIPEGLPAVVTIALALWVQRMVKRKVLMRKLHAVETLGSTTVICSDKTWTLTKNEMTVQHIATYTDKATVSWTGYATSGDISLSNDTIDLILRIWALCNDAQLAEENTIIGDPTEWALLVSAAKWWVDLADMNETYPREDELPFDSERKMMSTMHTIDGERLTYTKWAPDNVLSRSSHILIDGEKMLLDEEKRETIRAQYHDYWSQALRVLAFAYGTNDEEENLIFVWLQAMIDPPRQSTIEAVHDCNAAWIRVVMITWDHLDTAKAIAKEIGIQWEAMHGQDLSVVSDEEMIDIVKEYSVFARVNPKDKMKIVNALQQQWHTVAMTGDGVNDAPALKQSDIWICVWSWTDVAKEASEMVLLEDNFSAIIEAVEEWRGIYSNIKKFVRYLISSNLGEIATIFTAVMLGFNEMPVTAIMLLWINLMTDGLPAIALSVDPIDKDVMKQPPRKAWTHIIDKFTLIWMSCVAIVMMVWTIYMFTQWGELSEKQSLAFVTLVMFQLFNVLNCKSEWKSAFTQIWNNHWLLLAIAWSFILQIFVIETNRGHVIFGTESLEMSQWMMCIAVWSSVLILEEIRKLFVWSNGN